LNHFQKTNTASMNLPDKALGKAVEAATKFVGQIINPPLKEVGGLFADQVRLWRYKNQVNIVLKAKKYSEKKGIDPGMVPVKTLANLLDKGSYEEDESIQDKWAALLANAIDPDQDMAPHNIYVEILYQISPNEAKILDHIYARGISKMKRNEYLAPKYIPDLLRELEINEDPGKILIDNLIRLNTLEHSQGASGSKGIGGIHVVVMSGRIFMTALGDGFVKACSY